MTSTLRLATLDDTGNVPLDQLGNAPSGGGRGGSSTLAGDSDVTVSGPASSQGLVYNGSKWVNAALVNSFQGRTGVVTLTKNDVTGTGLAPADFGAATTASVSSAQTAAVAAAATAGDARYVHQDGTGLPLGTPSHPITDAAATRPSGLAVVYWQTATQPTNLAAGDIWIKTS